MTLPVTNTPFGPEDMARRKKRAIAMALVLAGLVILFFVTTLVHLGANVMNRSF
jgi:accessory gene regulator protein AgrB